jgi:S-formylglutathione hydrolase FrmB
VNSSRWLVVGVVLGTVCPPAAAGPLKKLHFRGELDRVNACLAGQVVDYTNNHGADHRLWSPALCQRRDLYVYLPPHFDPAKRYPFMMWLHGIGQDEKAFLTTVAPLLDCAVRTGKLPPVIIAAPDGSIKGSGTLTSGASFFLNSKAGRYEDYVIQDVWGFMQRHYPIRPEPESHALAGASMGGGAAFNLGIKYRKCFRVVLGVFPPLNTRWVDCHGNYRSKFDPCCWGWRTDIDNPCEVLARFGPIAVRVGQLIKPLYGRRDPHALEQMIRENPVEMLVPYHVRPGELEMFIAYGGKDEFNIDAQVESFLYVAHRLGLKVAVVYDPNGKHDEATAKRFFPAMLKWLAPRLAPYAP